jgi:Tfp pilus assembly protein PilV
VPERNLTAFHRTVAALARVRRRLRQEGGFGLVELVIAMTILNIGIFAALGAFSNGYVSLKRTKLITGAAVLQDAQLERFRALRFSSLCLSNTSTNTTYTANAPAGTVVATCTTTDPALVAVRTSVAGPNGYLFRVDTYVVWGCVVGTFTTASPFTATTPGCVTSGVQVSAAQKNVRVVIRDDATPSRIYARAESSFDESTGL